MANDPCLEPNISRDQANMFSKCRVKTEPWRNHDFSSLLPANSSSTLGSTSLLPVPRSRDQLQPILVLLAGNTGPTLSLNPLHKEGKFTIFSSTWWEIQHVYFLKKTERIGKLMKRNPKVNLWREDERKRESYDDISIALWNLKIHRCNIFKSSSIIMLQNNLISIETHKYDFDCSCFLSCLLSNIHGE